MAAKSFLTSTSAAIQTTTLAADWDDDGATIEGIGPGGNGAARQSSSIGGCGGGAGSYAKKTTAGLSASQVCYYLLPAGGTAVDAWFNDLNLALQTDNNIGGTSWSIEAATVSQSQTDPTGGSKATKLIESNTTALHGTYQFITKTASASIVLSGLIYAKTNGRNLIVSWDDNGVNFSYCVINLDDGSVAVAPATAGSGFTSPTVSVTDAGGGWWRVFFVTNVNTATTQTALVIRPNSGTTLNASYLGDGASGLYLYGYNATYGTVDKGFTPTTTVSKYSIYCKAGTNATTSAAGVGQSGSQGDSTAQGGGGFKPGTGVAIGGGGGGSGGPNGTGTTATTSAGGAADNSTVTGGAQGNAGNSGTEFDGSHGCGSGGGGRSGNGGGFAGGNYGGGGSGTGTQAGQTGGAGAPSLIILTPSFKPYLNMPTMWPAGRAM